MAKGMSAALHGSSEARTRDLPVQTGVTQHLLFAQLYSRPVHCSLLPTIVLNIENGARQGQAAAETRDDMHIRKVIEYA